MICRCFGRRFDPGEVLRAAEEVARRVAGAPDYEGYVAHLKDMHPGRAVPTRAEFLRRAGSRLRCC